MIGKSIAAMAKAQIGGERNVSTQIFYFRRFYVVCPYMDDKKNMRKEIGYENTSCVNFMPGDAFLHCKPVSNVTISRANSAMRGLLRNCFWGEGL